MCKNLLNSLTKCIRRLVRRMHDPKEKEENEMNFKETYRAEVQYFQNLKTIIESLDRWKAGESDEKIADILESCIQADKAIILLYKNLGQTWNELSAMIEKEIRDLEELKKTTEAYHDELNEKIDDVNNYLMTLIRELDSRVTSLESRMEAVEEDLSNLERNIFYDLLYDHNTDTYSLSKDGEPVTFSRLSADYLKRTTEKDVYASLYVRVPITAGVVTIPLLGFYGGSHAIFELSFFERKQVDGAYSTFCKWYAVSIFADDSVVYKKYDTDTIDVENLKPSIVYDLVKVVDTQTSTITYHLEKDGVTLTFDELEADYVNTPSLFVRVTGVAASSTRQFILPLLDYTPNYCANFFISWYFRRLNVTTGEMEMFPWWLLVAFWDTDNVDYTEYGYAEANVESLAYDPTPVRFEMVAEEENNQTVYKLYHNGSLVNWNKVRAFLYSGINPRLRDSYIYYMNTPYECIVLHLSEYDNTIPQFAWRRHYFTGNAIVEQMVTIYDSDVVTFTETSKSI